ncbi:alpha/beta fold hydrolase [Streptomyces sp. NPDC058877]|uniref:alpha/beta fold hydrolase n=1 Tax=unclassified Streptomyces TaxID=2593676 RepID=UPI0036883DC7
MDGETAFYAAYDAVLRRWPTGTRSIDVPSAYGTTRVHLSGPEGAAPLLLLPGGGTTSAVWFANVEALSRSHRVHAVDLMGDIGRSVHDGAPLRRTSDLMAWLDALLDALELAAAHVCGHSYGAWIALNYALHAPHRVSRLALLDPTNCFAGMSPRYLLRAAPMVLSHTEERQRAFLLWETGAAPRDSLWRDFLSATVSARRSKVLAMRRPAAGALRSCTVPTLVLLAERSRAHDVRRVATGARRLLPNATLATLADASHHSMPTEMPAELNRQLSEFLV